jgi:hypothetical protein
MGCSSPDLPGPAAAAAPGFSQPQPQDPGTGPRRQLREQPFACEAGWWGNKRLHEYLQIQDPAVRLQACRRARRQGSVHSVLWRQLAGLAAAGRMEVLEEAEVAGLEVACCSEVGGQEGEGARWAVRLAPSKAGAEAASAAARRRDAASAPSAFQQAVAAAGGGVPATTWGAAAAAATAAAAGAAPAAAEPPLQQLDADAIWVACGAAYNVERDPLLSVLLRQCPTPVVGGYPAVDDATLVWPGAPLFVVGRAAMLALGPCAGARSAYFSFPSVRRCRMEG